MKIRRMLLTAMLIGVSSIGATATAASLVLGAEQPCAIDKVDRDALLALIAQLQEQYGDRYAQAVRHRARLAELAPPAGDKPSESIETELVNLQREVLLFDVEKLVVIKRHEIDATHVYTYHYEGFRPGGGLYVVSPHDPTSKPLELAASPTGQILDCDLSHDGRTVLFSWRRKEDEGYHLWTVNVDGTHLKQRTDGKWHDYNACWLPDGDIAFLTTRAPQFAYCWHAPVGVLHRMKPDGSQLRQLSFNYLNDFTPQVLDDGRLIYSRWEYVDRPAIPIQSLWTMNPDGTGMSGYFGNRVLTPGTFMEARSIPDTEKIICTMTGHNGPARGAIGVIDRSQGNNAQQAITNLTPDTPLAPVDRGDGNTSGSKLYSSPVPLDRTRFLLSCRGPVAVRTLAGECQSTVLASPHDGMQYFAAQPIRRRKRPPLIPSHLSDDAESVATVFLQNVYDGLEGHVERGEIQTIRVIREMPKTVRIDPKYRAFGFQFPVISCGATYAGKDVLGEVPVNQDGSVCFHVPARVPVSFMPLDRQGRAVQRMRSFAHFQPGEIQGCVGCHANRNQQSPRPHSSLAIRRPPVELAPPEWGAGGFDYSRIVQPVLDIHCAKCHNPVESAGSLDLSGGKTDYFNVSYDVLAREHQGRTGTRYVNWIPTYNGHEQNILMVTPKTWGSPRSKLAEVVLSGHPDTKGQARVELDAASQRRILAWIDLNVPYYGTSETAYPGNPGCRRIYPAKLDAVLDEVARRRCASCHDGGKIPRRVWTRITEPQFNPFLVAPLAKAAGGNEKCGQAIFSSTDNPDYRAILATFESVAKTLQETPRMDMPGGKPAEDACRLTQ